MESESSGNRSQCLVPEGHGVRLHAITRKKEVRAVYGPPSHRIHSCVVH